MRVLGRKQYYYLALAVPRTNVVAIAAVIGAPYIAVRRHLEEGKTESNETPKKADDSEKKASNNGKQEAQAGERSVAEILRGDSRELAMLRDAVK